MDGLRLSVHGPSGGHLSGLTCGCVRPPGERKQINAVVFNAGPDLCKAFLCLCHLIVLFFHGSNDIGMGYYAKLNIYIITTPHL